MTNLQEYGYNPKLNTLESEIARIIAVHKDRYEIVCKYGITHARLKSSVYYIGNDQSADSSLAFPTVGDFVEIQYNDCGDSMILRTLPRKTFFSRRDPTPGRGEQAVAANFEYVFILMSLNHDFNERRLERYLALAWQSGGVPVVILTKADLTDDCSYQLARMQQLAFGIDVIAVSAKTGYGLDALACYVKPGNTIVFLGSSGVGKSSLVNAIAGEEIMKISGIREDDSKGRHTTTHRQLTKLKGGAMIIDTPGMRELGMWDISEGLGDTFGDVEEHLGQCRFTNCQHKTEPGCAIREALKNGRLSATRWQSYLKLKREAKYSDKKDLQRARLQQRSAASKHARNPRLPAKQQLLRNQRDDS